MLKNIFLKALFVILLLPIVASAQLQEGSVRYLIVHNWTKKMAAVDYISKQQKERISYMWGNDSEWKKYARLYFKGNQTRYEDSGEQAEKDEGTYSWRKETFQIKRDFDKNQAYDVIEMLGKTYIVEDSIHAQPWKILNDLKEVAGHLCMNAVWTDSIKQQKITVWFALDIPLSGGPERLCGLPGLILEADVNEGALTVTADLVETKKIVTEIDLPKKYKGKKIDEAKYWAILREHIETKRKDEEPYFWDIRY